MPRARGRFSAAGVPPAAAGRMLPGIAAPGLPFLAACTLRTDDGNAAIRRIAGDRLHAVPGGLMLPPEHAGGAALIFAA